MQKPVHPTLPIVCVRTTCVCAPSAEGIGLAVEEFISLGIEGLQGVASEIGLQL